MSEHHRRLERMFLAGPCNQKFDELRIEVSGGRAEVSFEVTPDLRHAGGGMHGAYFFKALDDAAFFAASSMVEDVFLLTTDFSVQFLRSVSEGRLIATGEVTKPGRTLLFVDSVVTRDGVEVARGRGSFTRSKMPLGDIALYR